MALEQALPMLMATAGRIFTFQMIIPYLIIYTGIITTAVLPMYCKNKWAIPVNLQWAMILPILIMTAFRTYLLWICLLKTTTDKNYCFPLTVMGSLITCCNPDFISSICAIC